MTKDQGDLAAASEGDIVARLRERLAVDRFDRAYFDEAAARIEADAAEIERLRAEVAALRAAAVEAWSRQSIADKADAERYRWLRDEKCNSLHLTRDHDHACNYMTASDWIDANPEWYAETDPAELERMRATNTIWNLQIYPNTPVGFNSWDGSTLDAVIDAARRK